MIAAIHVLSRGRMAPLAAAGGVVLALTVSVAPADAATGRCPQGTGVTVVVDYGPLRDGVDIGCDPEGAGEAASKVVPAAGFPLTYVSGEPFVCRINGLPGQDQEGCARTPPEDAYWALYWSDGESQEWNYSTSGVASLEVPEGGSIGWMFQNGGAREVPGEPPTSAAKPSPTPQPKPSNSPAPKPATPPKTTAPAPTATPSRSGPPTEDEPVPAPGNTSTPRGGDQNPALDGGPAAGKGEADKGRESQGANDQKKRASERRKPEASGESAVDDSEVVALEQASGEPLTEEESSTGLTLVAGAAVLLLGAAAGVIAWRRRV